MRERAEPSRCDQDEFVLTSPIVGYRRREGETRMLLFAEPTVTPLDGPEPYRRAATQGSKLGHPADTQQLRTDGLLS
ncbi:MAG: hypothetical protein ACRC67_16435 [Inquilinus sp.]|uniref:hypothetical protein n=1 Tax=Inquilinus sp. TaxID=1932117 RepID=UPI003F405ADE